MIISEIRSRVFLFKFTLDQGVLAGEDLDIQDISLDQILGTDEMGLVALVEDDIGHTALLEGEGDILVDKDSLHVADTLAEHWASEVQAHQNQGASLLGDMLHKVEKVVLGTVLEAVDNLLVDLVKTALLDTGGGMPEMNLGKGAE